jgi:deoxycytidylate deaminase
MKTPFRKAAKQAGNSNHPLFHMGAVITKGGCILSSASNQINRGCSTIRDKKWKNTLHAEAHAIHKLLKVDMGALVGASMYITRINKQGSVMLAKPCPFCLSLIQAVGIKAVYYTTNDGGAKCLKM